MTVTSAEMQVMSIRELAAARWRTNAALVGWLYLGYRAIVGFLRLVGVLAPYRDVVVPHPAAVILGVLAIIGSALGAWDNYRALKLLRATLHAARAARPLLERYR